MKEIKIRFPFQTKKSTESPELPTPQRPQIPAEAGTLRAFLVFKLCTTQRTRGPEQAPQFYTPIKAFRGPRRTLGFLPWLPQVTPHFSWQCPLISTGQRPLCSHVLQVLLHPQPSIIIKKKKSLNPSAWKVTLTLGNALPTRRKSGL